MKLRSLALLTAATVVMGGCAVNKPWTLAEGQHPQSLSRGAMQPPTRLQLYLPQGFDSTPGRKWPLIIFLHGSGERGDDIEKVKLHGPPKIVASRTDFPFIVASPQAPHNTRWTPTAVNQVLDELLERLPVDVDRVYLTGLSLGGHGTWATAADRPDRFAAIAPVCGAGDVKTACQLKHTPIWAFHGEKDSVVSIQGDQAMVDAVKACGGDVQFTVYPGVDHDSWTQTYDNPKLYEWFLQHKRGAPKP